MSTYFANVSSTVCGKSNFNLNLIELKMESYGLSDLNDSWDGFNGFMQSDVTLAQSRLHKRKTLALHQRVQMNIHKQASVTVALKS